VKIELEKFSDSPWEDAAEGTILGSLLTIQYNTNVISNYPPFKVQKCILTLGNH